MTNSSSNLDLLEVGRVDRGHGLKGEVLASITTTMVSERTAPGAELYIGGAWLTVRSSRPHQKKWLLTFDGVTDRNSAEAMRGPISAQPIEAEGEVFIHELIGKTLVDQHGQCHGTVVSVIDNPASDLLELQSGALVPLAFYVALNGDNVEVNVPIGLLDGESLE